ncbi:MAG: hypothetical protein JW909_00730 [Planctomycetes bacterium]|nr:hypothetical protein [Planctomycetota bacterium]
MRLHCLPVVASLLFCGAAGSAENIILYENFDSGALDAKLWEKAELVASPTVNGSPGAARAVPMLNNLYFGIGLSRDLKTRPATKVGTVLFFWYYCDTVTTFKIQINTDSPNGNIAHHFSSVPNVWVPVYLPFSSMRFDNNVPADTNGTVLKSVNVYGGGRNSKINFYVDQMALYYDDPPQDIAREIALQKLAVNELNANLATDRYTLDRRAVYRIRSARTAAEKPAKAKSVMTAGSAAANSTSFIQRLRNGSLKGYSFVSISRATGRNKPLAAIQKDLERHLPREKPEVIFIMPGVEDMLNKASHKDISTALNDIVDLCLANGAAPVLCSAPERLNVPTPMAQSAQGMNSIIKLVADTKMIPFLDACSIVNANQKKNFSQLKITMAGYDAINDRAAALHAALAHWAFDRLPESLGGTGDKDTPGKDGGKKPDIPDDVQQSIDEIEI